MTASTKKTKMSASEATSALIKAVLKMPAGKIIALLKELEEKRHENKRLPRLDYCSEVTFSVNGRFYSGYIENINANGIFIETEALFKPGEKATLTFGLPGAAENIKITGEIVRVAKEGIGIRFDLDIEAFADHLPETKTAGGY